MATVTRATTTTSVIDDLAKLGDKIKDELDVLEERRTTSIVEHRKELNKIQAEQGRLRRVLRAIGQENKLPSPKRKGRNMVEGVPERTGMGVSKPRAAKVAQTCRAFVAKTGQETFSAPEIHRFGEYTGDPSVIYPAFNYLRSIEFLGKANKKGRTDHWRILDNQAIDRVLEEMNAR